MEIKSTLFQRTAGILDVIYRDVDSASEMGNRGITGVHAFCFCNGKLVVVYAAEKGYWQPPGGGVEAGETFEQAVTREVQEETNMRVLSQKLLGYQDISEPHGITTQTRSVCIVEPYGDFVSDPDGDITEIKLIDPADYKQYFDWSIIGEHLMRRAVEFVKTIEK